MPRKKYQPTDPKHVNPVEKMKRRAKSGPQAKGKSVKPRVRLGTAASRALGIGR